MIGRAGSKGYPKKNILNVFGKKLCEYPLIAANKSKTINKIYVSTDCPIIKKVSKKYNVSFINRPKKLSTNKALGDNVFEHAYNEIKKIEKNKIQYLVLLFANAPLVTKELINKGISILKRNPKAEHDLVEIPLNWLIRC